MAAEKQFEDKLKDYLTSIGCWFIKYWGGAAYTKSGIPDLLVCNDGKFLAIEVKAPKGKPTLLQIVTLEKIRQSNGYGLLLYPKDFEDFKKWVTNKTEFQNWYNDNIALQQSWKNKLLNEEGVENNGKKESRRRTSNTGSGTDKNTGIYCC